jgi:hypothetical protein
LDRTSDCDTTICIKAILFKQQYEQALAAKLEVQHVFRAATRASAFQKTVIIAKSKVSGKQTEVAAILKEQRRN